jgi:hypothetical protein|tara:strand:- start:1861 stop:2262 length:402 start_codon:yes stop_codon:yes gene_type:complete
MATTTATLTISSADLTSNPLSITTSSTLYKAGTTIGLEQTTGLAKKVYAAAQSNTTLISAGDYADDTHSRIYIRNSGSSTTDFFTVTIASGNSVIGRLYGGDFLFIPYEGEEDIDISSSATNMELEFMVINEG